MQFLIYKQTFLLRFFYIADINCKCFKIICFLNYMLEGDILKSQNNNRNNRNLDVNLKESGEKKTIFSDWLFKLPGYENFLSFICKLSIRRRLIIFFLILSIIPILVVGLISYHSSERTITNKITKYSLESLIQATTTLDLKMQKYENLSVQLQINNENQTAINDFIKTSSDKSKEMILKTIKDCLAFDADVHYIILGSLQDNSCIGTGFGDLESVFAKFKESDVYEEALNTRSDLCWGIFDTDIAMVRTIYNLTTNEPIAVFTVIFYGYKLNQLINASRYDDSAVLSLKNRPYSLLLRLDGKILSSPNSEEIGTEISNLLHSSKITNILQENQSRNGYFFDQIENKNILVTYNQIPSRNWYVLGLAENNYLYKETKMLGIFTFLIILIISLIAIIISYCVSLSISIPLDQVKGAMEKAKNGDLTVEVEINTQDELNELGNSFNLMTAKIGDLIRDAKEAVTSVSKHSKVLESSSIQSAQSAEAVSTASSEITKGTIEQTSEAEKTARQMSVLANEIEVAATKSVEVEKITSSTRNLSLRSKAILELLIQKANETDIITNTIASDISDLNKRSEEIKSITELISNIAEQTNLLALNAAIEAARAQEKGLGFAVVAEEVNKLAGRSETAATTINQILGGIQEKALSSTENVAKAHQIVLEQLQVVSQTQETFEEIILLLTVLPTLTVISGVLTKLKMKLHRPL